VETLNPIRSFKGRGADYYMRSVPAGQHVICGSAGNFGQALAYAARARGIGVRVFAATNANPVKVRRMRELGAQVTLTGDDFDAAKSAARQYASQRSDCVFVEDGAEPRIAEGAGSIAVELAALQPGTVFVPVGNGALIGGIARWIRVHSPGTLVVGACAAAAPAMAHSWQAGTPTPTATADTIADGIAIRQPVPAAVDWMRGHVDDFEFVSEERIAEAVRAAQDTLGLILEPAGAVAIAAALQRPLNHPPVAVIITGSNISTRQVAASRVAADKRSAVGHRAEGARRVLLELLDHSV
jgi:threonine dehydratase